MIARGGRWRGGGWGSPPPSGVRSPAPGGGRRGGPPPRHVHEHEDEAFYVLEGRLTATIGGDTTLTAGPGECVFLPRGKAHSLHAETPEIRGLALLAPAGFEQFFAAIGQPATTRQPPEPAAPHRPTPSTA